jgi:hypothetical protein
VSSTRTVSLRPWAAPASLHDGTIGVSNEIGDSGVDCQNHIAFVIEVVGTLNMQQRRTDREIAMAADVT